ncbi:FimV/HubP family polar landmark protein [Psychrobacter urativorans]|uniref:FimV/HubP family polar landmark protein n=1 Tax=Psychrobacter urativorans TaxID=45610 RepID=UPI00191B72F7|nr:FimV/HubP family polar landmark protein [Psychrobacter urativorans]
MDNMLYIIAGLVIILMVGVWVLRKNKAQQPPASPRAQTVNRGAENAATLATKTKPATSAKQGAGGLTSSPTKFDDLTVAQRFMDQQRYDKAIETLERGLIEKPHDNELSLKLLNIYALTNQHDEFHRTYDAIQAYSDPVSIKQAQQLKGLLAAEQSSAAFSTVTDNSMTLDSETLLPNDKKPDFNDDKMSLDFDKPTPSTDYEQLSSPTASRNNDNINNNTSNHHDAFELTLDDLETPYLETSDLEQANLENSSINTSTNTTNNVAADSDAKAPVLNIDDANSINKVNTSADDDFTLDFDMLSDDISADPEEDREKNELTLSDDDFVLDFSNLAEETEANNESNAADTPANPALIDDGFTLFLNEADPETVAADTATTNAPTAQTQASSVNDTARLNTSIIEDTLTDGADFIDFDFDIDTNIDADTSNDLNTGIAIGTNESTLTPTFDDDTGIDYLDFDINDTDASSTTTPTPVITESNSINLDGEYVDTLTSADFDAQFASDFDFVKTLDNNQITLDLAGQYLQLGEYDSAKRLLNEVVAQGNSEQQQQAQELLTRTA